MSAESYREVICNGEIEILKLTTDIHDEVVEFYKNNFMPNENVSIACKLSSSELSVAEVEGVVRAVLQDNLGFVARNCSSGELVAICINKVLVPETEAALGFQFQSPGVICGGEFVHRMKGSFNLFKEWNIDCAMEIVFLSTRKDYGGRSLATILSEHSMKFVQQWVNGTLPEKDELAAHIKNLKPQAVCSIFTSLFTQKVGEKLGLETLVKIPFTEFFFEGKSFAESINPMHKFATYAATRI